MTRESSLLANSYQSNIPKVLRPTLTSSAGQSPPVWASQTHLHSLKDFLKELRKMVKVSPAKMFCFLMGTTFCVEQLFVKFARTYFFSSKYVWLILKFSIETEVKFVKKKLYSGRMSQNWTMEYGHYRWLRVNLTRLKVFQKRRKGKALDMYKRCNEAVCQC